jgi:hypothetical protein
MANDGKSSWEEIPGNLRSCVDCRYSRSGTIMDCLGCNADNGWPRWIPSQLQSDKIHHPSHYTHGKYETWDVIEDWGLCYLLGNVVKYISRARHKGSELEDLQKAAAYLKRKIEIVQAKLRQKE